MFAEQRMSELVDAHERVELDNSRQITTLKFLDRGAQALLQHSSDALRNQLRQIDGATQQLNVALLHERLVATCVWHFDLVRSTRLYEEKFIMQVLRTIEYNNLHKGKYLLGFSGFVDELIKSLAVKKKYFYDNFIIKFDFLEIVWVYIEIMNTLSKQNLVFWKIFSSFLTTFNYCVIKDIEY